MELRKASKAKVPVQSVLWKRGHEFGRSFGAVGFIFGLSTLIYAFTFLCNDVSGCPAPSLLDPSTLSLDKLEEEVGWPQDGLKAFFNMRVTMWVLSYYFLSLILYVFLPGEVVEGTELACKGRLRYKFNAFSSAIWILSGLALGTYVYGADFVIWVFIWDNYLQIITANLVICIVLATFVYAKSFSVPKLGQPNPKLRELAPGGHTGNALYDFFLGRELNPRIQLPIPFVDEASRTIDINVWCEMRPGLLGWIILNLSNMARQYRTYGYISNSIVLSTASQTFYVLDALYMEPAVLTTMDVIMDGFGYMLSFGHLVWVPFIYNLQTRYLAVFPVVLSLRDILLILTITGVGYWIFRGANNQKNRFRTDPNDPHLKHIKYIQTSSGSKLMISGWWGLARHINYLGDWLMSWSYSLPTGVAGYTIIESINGAGDIQKQAIQTPEVRGWGIVFTYFFMLYFGILLIHREGRDEEKCKRKYGADWKRYTSIVRSRIIPGIY
ncbi:Ergosterol biosynthesis ERG4/ERG24 [Penicillium verrucosum]|uniref:Ergosterol biosynthesis ERG4/ERG24 n=1 Tax=Penicillium verrucosum TaxID=60171 RepID=UPI0025453B94|nr:Ergosterol biosynthesis ERG4/ERG24 [Penicillium verrucosum]KAJ5943494.1 Ergosterol biosynthesis ERG4/ERG24 [Penicillium verrucosum]